MSSNPHQMIHDELGALARHGSAVIAHVIRESLDEIDRANRARVSELLEANNDYQQQARDAKQKALVLEADAVRRSDWNLKLTNELMDAKAEIDRLQAEIEMARVNASDELGMKDVARVEDLIAICKAAGVTVAVGASPAEIVQAAITRVEFMNKGGKDLHEKYLKLVEADRERILTQDGQARGLLHGALSEFEKFFQIQVDANRGAYARLSDVFDRMKRDFAGRHEEIMKAEGAADRAYEGRAGFLAALQSLLGLKGRNPLNGALFGEQALEVLHELRFQLGDDESSPNTRT